MSGASVGNVLTTRKPDNPTNPPDILLRRHKAGIELLMREGCRLADLLALATWEVEGPGPQTLRPGR